MLSCGSFIELLEVQPSGQLKRVARQPVFGTISKLCTFSPGALHDPRLDQVRAWRLCGHDLGQLGRAGPRGAPCSLSRASMRAPCSMLAHVQCRIFSRSERLLPCYLCH